MRKHLRLSPIYVALVLFAITAQTFAQQRANSADAPAGSKTNNSTTNSKSSGRTAADIIRESNERMQQRIDAINRAADAVRDTLTKKRQRNEDVEEEESTVTRRERLNEDVERLRREEEANRIEIERLEGERVRNAAWEAEKSRIEAERLRLEAERKRINDLIEAELVLAGEREFLNRLIDAELKKQTEQDRINQLLEAELKKVNETSAAITSDWSESDHNSIREHRTVYVKNNSQTRHIQITEVTIYECRNVTLECGTTYPGPVIPPGQVRSIKLIAPSIHIKDGESWDFKYSYKWKFREDLDPRPKR